MEHATVRITERNGHSVLSLSGTIDIFVVQDLYDAARTLLEGGEDIRMQWAAVETMDVSTLQVLLALQAGLHAQGRHLHCEDVSAAMRQILMTSGLATRLGSAEA